MKIFCQFSSHYNFKCKEQIRIKNKQKQTNKKAFAQFMLLFMLRKKELHESQVNHI